MAFYDDMQNMVRDMLRPDTDGGFGQGEVVLTRTTPWQPAQGEPEWEGGPVSVETATLRAAVTGAKGYADGKTVLATDLRVVAAVPAMNWKPPAAGARTVLSITIDQVPYNIVKIGGIPAAGTPAAIEIFVRA